MSSVSIIGTGDMAAALAGRALAGGNAVEIIGRDPARAGELAAGLDGATVGTFDAVPAGDLVVLAVPYAGAAAVVGEFGDALRGKVVVDLTNPVSPDAESLVTPDDSSGAQEIAKAVPTGAHVVKAFNTVFGHMLARGGALDVLLAGDDAEAKAAVSAFITSLGLRPRDTGPLAMARWLEGTGLLMISLGRRGGSFDFALGVETSDSALGAHTSA
ncbi:putative dinucleotide-binding enzyme [Streptomyces sp. B3I7]|uniref:NADPH-dependent F420 reductase n=1 Tax=Streptomyces sp. B3I7 TaxID=3042269 RepID=UPI0027839B0C|nr:NAD(P)-binding domain-containing protein [Streptomyces sp. B3I7]MDQ0810371.1 putative dinucleotide-binding enzyme [Streptomyces sp. B3I7]